MSGTLFSAKSGAAISAAVALPPGEALSVLIGGTAFSASVEATLDSSSGDWISIGTLTSSGVTNFPPGLAKFRLNLSSGTSVSAQYSTTPISTINQQGAAGPDYSGNINTALGNASAALQLAQYSSGSIGNGNVAALSSKGGAEGPQFADNRRWLWVASGVTADGGMVVAAADGGFWKAESGVTVTPRNFGATPGTNATTQIQAALNSALVTTVAIDATYTCGYVTVPAGKKLIDQGGKLVGISNAPNNSVMIEVLANAEVNGVNIDGNKPNGTGSGTIGIHIIGAGAKVLNNRVSNCGQQGIWAHGIDATWGTIHDYLIAGNIVTNCNSAGIVTEYTIDGQITGNRVDGCAQGIQWWGGDSAVTTNRHTSRLTISGNNVSNIVGGGIWGSCGAAVNVTGNTVTSCGDVGIDYEGSSGSCTGNTVSECVNGAITGFYNASDVTISGNTIIQSGAMGSTAHGIWLPTNSRVKNFTISGNTISIYGSGAGIYSADYGSIGEMKAHSNTISTIGGLGIYTLHSDAWDIQGNTINQTSAGTAIQIDGGNRNRIERNTLRTASDPSSGVDRGGIFLNQKTDVGGYACQRNLVRGNTVEGYAISINDNAFADKSSFSMIDGNGVTTNIRKPSTSYQGVTTANYVLTLPASAASYTLF